MAGVKVVISSSSQGGSVFLFPVPARLVCMCEHTDPLTLWLATGHSLELFSLLLTAFKELIIPKIVYT